MVGGGIPLPPYPHRHAGPVLVCGNGHGLLDDLRRAWELFPKAPIIAVNGSARLVKASFLFTQHPLLYPRWIKAQRQMHKGFTTHAAGNAHIKTKIGIVPAYDYVDYWWEGVASGGTSGWGARRLATYLGFSKVILCGVPLDPVPYADGRPARHFQRTGLLQHYRDQIKADIAWHHGVFSMSGWTRELFGEP